MSGWIHGGLKGAIKFALVMAVMREWTVIEWDTGSFLLTEAVNAPFLCMIREGSHKIQSRKRSLYDDYHHHHSQKADPFMFHMCISPT